jgi:hypothetical protein
LISSIHFGQQTKNRETDEIPIFNNELHHYSDLLNSANKMPSTKSTMNPPESTPIPSTTTPHLTKSMNPQLFDKSAMGTAWQAQQQQPFGKNNL